MALSLAELRSRLVGVNATMATPFDSEGHLDLEMLGKLVDYVIDGGVGLISYPLTVGESGSLTFEEHCLAVERVVQQAGGRVPVVAGAVRASTQECIEIARRAAAAGADGIVGMAPYYYKLTQKEVLLHFSLLADSTPLGLLVYDHPAATKVAIAPDTARRLADLPQVVAFLPTTNDVSVLLQLKRSIEGGAELMGGREEQLLCARSFGLRNITSATANFAPRFFVQLWEYARVGDLANLAPGFALLLEWRELMQPSLVGGHFGSLASYTKLALQLLGMPSGDVRPPLVQPSGIDVERLRSLLRRMGLEVT